MLTVTDIIILIIGVIFLAIWLNFYAKGKKYAYIVETLNDEDDKYKRLYIVGYAAVESLGR
ncbi:MAG: pilus assembly protein TadC, partial [Clostridia bacterium]|nr:pilus assembly protein TadC [Clostridia bacterium]